MHLDDAKLQKEFDELTDQISEEDKNELVRRTSVDAFFTAEKESMTFVSILSLISESMWNQQA